MQMKNKKRFPETWHTFCHAGAKKEIEKKRKNRLRFSISRYGAFVVQHAARRFPWQRFPVGKMGRHSAKRSLSTPNPVNPLRMRFKSPSRIGARKCNASALTLPHSVPVLSLEKKGRMQKTTQIKSNRNTMVKLTDTPNIETAKLYAELENDSFQNVMETLHNDYDPNSFRYGFAYVTTERGKTYSIPVNFRDEDENWDEDEN
jgi:hypothetical protein